MSLQSDTNNDIFIIPSQSLILFSGSEGNPISLYVEPSGSVNFVGTTGSILKIMDNLSGSLFSVNNISGLSILEVFSDNQIKMGNPANYALVVSGSNVIITGSLVDKGTGVKFLVVDTATGVVHTTGSGGGGGSSTTPGGSPTQIQYNSASAFEGVPTLTYDGTILRATGSFTGSLTGSLFGTSSWAQSASQAITASYINISSSNIATLEVSYATPGVIALLAKTGSGIPGGSTNQLQFNAGGNLFGGVNNSSYNNGTGQLTLGNVVATGSFTGSFTGSLLGTASFADSASRAISASFSTTASYVNIQPGPRIQAVNHSNGITTITGSIGGSDTHIQFNSGSAFSGSSNFTFDYINNKLELIGQTNESGFTMGNYSFEEDIYVPNTSSRGSLAIGTDTKATPNTYGDGYYPSFAQGLGTQANSDFSHAEGNTTQANGDGSHSEGEGTIASGSNSHAEGNETISQGQSSHAEGNNTLTIGGYSHAEGDQTQAIGDNSHTEGYRTYSGISTAYSSSILDGVAILSGSYGDISSDFNNGDYLYIYDSPFDGNYNHESYIISQSYFASPNTIIELYDESITTTIAYIGNTVGLDGGSGDKTIPGNGSHAEGERNYTLGDYSHAEGLSTNALGNYSHTEGTGTQALGQYSHAEGDGSISIGLGSHSEGQNSISSGSYSHAEGANTVALGDYSHTEGNNTVASASYQTVVGSYNVRSNERSVFVVGIGNDTTFKDGFTVDVDSNLSGSIMIPTNNSDPISPKAGSMYFNPSTNLLYIYNGTAWRSSSFS